MSERMFPIMKANDIPWSLIEPHEKQAHANHGQTLQRLAERGGLDVGEALAIIEGRRWGTIKTDKDSYARYAEQLQALVRAARKDG